MMKSADGSASLTDSDPSTVERAWNVCFRETAVMSEDGHWVESGYRTLIIRLSNADSIIHFTK